MKKNSLLEFGEQKELYDKFSVDTLESLDTIYYYIIDEKPPIAFNIIYQQKYEENADNYNGREELTESTLIDNIDISEITNNLKNLSDQELSVISRPIYKAISKADPSNPDLKLMKKLMEFNNEFNIEIEKRFTPIYEGMLPKDVKEFFLKFSLTGLEFFDNILDYTNHDRIDEIKRVRNEAIEAKHKRYTNNSTTTISTVTNYNLTQFKSSFKSLTDLELEFLHSLVEDASLYLDSIQDYSDYYKEIIEDFDINDYPIELVNELLKLVETEQTVVRQKQYAPMNLELEAEKKEKTK